MKSYDFEYDGICLSDMGYIICNFNPDGLNTISNGSQINFNTVSTQNGAIFETVNVEYTQCLEATIQICKNPCINDNLEISVIECRDLMRWLNRQEFHKFKILNDEYMSFYFEASFNIDRIEVNGKLYGLELHLITNRPFALHEPKQIMIDNTVENGVKVIYDTSDKEGFIYPRVEIKVQANGNLQIHNSIENRTTFIRNCVVGEIITMDYPMISSSLSSHNIQNDFNWNFIRIANTYRNKQNKLTISLPCFITMSYSPIVEYGL